MRHRFLAGLLAAAAMLAMFGGPAGARAEEIKSLRGAVGIEDNNAPPQIYDTAEGNRFQRAFRQQPPLIPHRIDKYEIDRKVNQCLRCHDWPYNVDERAPKVSETHYVDRQGKRLDKVSGNRWFCTECHVPQQQAEPLVRNVFESAVPAR